MAEVKGPDQVLTMRGRGDNMAMVGGREVRVRVRAVKRLDERDV